METTCHYGSTGLSLLPWPCPGHINPSDRIARTCPSFWVSIYTTWQSLWPSLTQGSGKSEGEARKKKKKVILVTLARPDGTEYFHWFVVLAHFRRRARTRKCFRMSTESCSSLKISGERNTAVLTFFFFFFFFCLAWFPIIEKLPQNWQGSWKKRRKKREKKTLRVWWKKTLTWKVLECWPLRLTSLNMFPQAIP